ncbi:MULTISPECIES: hypothetical protein [Pseudomonas]|uniref:Uncharacterized protein n=1 Tax=Pseudomonas helmanticensis TaxID=1471381 RepID=A0ACD2U3H1_9PSED|nr:MULTISPECIES: hypothetical protein [Pseudomonas]WPN77487.1 hypothetical protein QMK46_14290 [Pseudomonas germanica]SMQ24560.1 hypothetical protein SAMN04488483_1714 [Pseudomonas helmanticensis]
MNVISAAMYQSKHTRAPHPVFTIDSIPLGNWIKGVIYDAIGNDDTDGLVPAQGWLTDDDHSRYAWQVLEPNAEDSSTIVPLLICPDDMDLSCTVAVVEQVIRGETVIWERFGRAVDIVSGVITAVAWNEKNQRALFQKVQFQDALSAFKRLTEHEWV